MSDKPKRTKGRSIFSDLDEADDYNPETEPGFDAGKDALIRLLSTQPDGTATYGCIARELPEYVRFLDSLIAHLSSDGFLEYDPKKPPPSRIRLLDHQRFQKHLANWHDHNSFLYPDGKKNDRTFPTEAMNR